MVSCVCVCVCCDVCVNWMCVVSCVCGDVCLKWMCEVDVCGFMCVCLAMCGGSGCEETDMPSACD